MSDVGSIGSLSFDADKNSSASGACFLLRKAPARSATVHMDGWVVKIAAGENAVVAAGGSAGHFSHARQTALLAANKALDYLSARGLADVSITDSQDDCIAWWSTGGKLILRARVTTTQTGHFTVSLRVRDSAGKDVTPPDPTPTWHPALRFLRMARTTSYLYDSYRNMFLALEAILSDIRPRVKTTKNRLEGEGYWFKQALLAADVYTSHSELAPAGTADAMKWILHNIYGDDRSGLMHAKGNSSFHLPESPESQIHLVSSIENLGRYTQKLVTGHLGVARTGGGLTTAGWQLITDSMLTTGRGAVLVAPSGNADLSSNGRVIPLVSSSQVLHDPGFLSSRVWEVPASDITAAGSVARLGLWLDDVADFSTYSALESPLQLGSLLESFQVQIGLRNVNSSNPVPHFAS